MRLRNLISKQILFHPKTKSNKPFCTKNSANDIIFPDRSIEYFMNPNKYTYIDKTKFIERALSNTSTEIFYQPDSFGKSFNLDIFRYFVSDLNKVDYTVDKSKRREFFEKTEIFKNKEIVEKHFQKHPVIYLNFKELDEKTFEDNIEKLKIMLNLEIDFMFQYENSKNLTAYELKIFDEFISNMKNVSLQSLSNMPKEIARVLSKLSGNNAFILLNNIDYPLIHSYGRKCYEEFKPFLESFVKNTFKNNNYIYKGLLTGVNELEHSQTFLSLNNLKSYSFKDSQDAEANKCFGVNIAEDTLAKGPNGNSVPALRNFSKAISLFNNNTNSISNSNLSFINFFRSYNRENLRELNEENLMKLFNIDSISEYLKLKTLFGNLINESSKDYLSGYKLLNILNNEAENFLNNFFNANNNKSKSSEYSEATLTLKPSTSEDISFSLENPLKSSAFLSYLQANNIISITQDGKNSIKIPNLQSALLIKSAFSKQTYHTEDYDRKLAYNFYRYLYFNKIPEYFQEIKSIFDVKRKSAGTAKISPLSKQLNLNFKSEKELEKYFVHIMTLELNVQDSAEKLNIFAVDDYENTQVSDLLKEFTLITFDDKKFAIFIRFNKHKLASPSPAAEELNEIDEVQNNEVVKKSKKTIPKVDLNVLKANLQNINEEKISKIDKEEAVAFLKHISDQFQAVSFVSVSNYKNYLEFSSLSFLINDGK